MFCSLYTALFEAVIDLINQLYHYLRQNENELKKSDIRNAIISITVFIHL